MGNNGLFRAVFTLPAILEVFHEEGIQVGCDRTLVGEAVRYLLSLRADAQRDDIDVHSSR